MSGERSRTTGSASRQTTIVNVLTFAHAHLSSVIGWVVRGRFDGMLFCCWEIGFYEWGCVCGWDLSFFSIILSFKRVNDLLTRFYFNEQILPYFTTDFTLSR